MALSSKTLETDNTSWSSTSDDVDAMYEWEFGDSEPKGSHALNFAPHRRLRNDLKRGRSNAGGYENNMIFIDTTKLVSDQLRELNN